MIVVAAVLGLLVLSLGTAVLVAGVRRRRGGTVATGALGIALGLAVLVPAALVGTGLLVDR